MSRLIRNSVWIAFVAYALYMLWLLFGQRLPITVAENGYLASLQCNVIPFETVSQFLPIILTGEPAYLVEHAIVNLLGNVVMFVPLGLFLAILFPSCRSLCRFTLSVIAVILGVELTQFFTLLGSLDFDDLLLNTFGALLGLGIFCLFRHIIQALKPHNY